MQDNLNYKWGRRDKKQNTLGPNTKQINKGQGANKIGIRNKRAHAIELEIRLGQNNNIILQSLKGMYTTKLVRNSHSQDSSFGFVHIGLRP